MRETSYEETEYRNFLGVGPDLMVAAKDSVRFAVDELARSLRVEPHEAYAVLGMAGELRIHEIVDQPDWGAADPSPPVPWSIGVVSPDLVQGLWQEATDTGRTRRFRPVPEQAAETD